MDDKQDNRSKVVPIHGRHETVHSMLAEAMTEPTAHGAIVLWFTAEGVMNTDSVNMTRSTLSMAAAYTAMLAIDCMRNADV